VILFLAGIIKPNASAIGWAFHVSAHALQNFIQEFDRGPWARSLYPKPGCLQGRIGVI
jgi:hypothetical protein